MGWIFGHRKPLSTIVYPNGQAAPLCQHPAMNLYLISQSENDDYDTYDSVVVAAATEDAARQINPDGKDRWGYKYSGWCKSPDAVSVKLLGIAASDIQPGVILASFNAG